MVKKFALLVLFLPSIAFATHLKCGNITLKKVSGLTFLVTINIYTNLNSPIRSGDGYLNFGDGAIHVTPTLQNTLVDPNIGYVSYSIEHTYPKSSTYKISYYEQNLESDILNLTNSIDTPFYLEASASLDENTDYSSPEFLLPPIFHLPLGYPFSFSNAAYDKNNYRLVYDLTSPVLYANYTQPESLTINHYNGIVTWDAKYQGVQITGKFLFAVKVSQVDDKGIVKGSITRSFQITSEDDVSKNVSLKGPSLDVNGTVFANQTKSFLFEADGYEPVLDDGWDIYMDKTIQRNVNWSKSSFSGLLRGKVDINPTTDIVRDNPYNIVLRLKYRLGNKYNEPYYRDVPLLFFTKNVPLTPITPLTVPEPEKNKEPLAFPNPCYDFLTIFSDTAGEVEIKNMTGQTLEKIYTLPIEIINFNNYPAGCYFLSIS
jgi:hypothetical protein